MFFAFIHQEARKLCFYSPKTDKTYFFGLAVRRQAILDWNSDFGVYFCCIKETCGKILSFFAKYSVGAFALGAFGIQHRSY